MKCEYTTSRATVRFLAHWVTLCIVIPVLSFSGSEMRNASLTLLFPLVVIVYSGTRLAVIATKGSNRIVETTFWLYIYIFMGICALLQVAANHFPWPGHYSGSMVVSGELLIIGGMLAFDLGRHIKRGRRKLSNISVGTHFEISRNRLYVVAVSGMLVAVYATQKLGGFTTLFLNRNERYSIVSQHLDIAQFSIYSSLAKTTVYVLLVVTISYLIYGINRYKSNNRLFIYLLLGALILFTGIENNPIATARFQVGTIILSIYFMFPWKKYKTSIAVYGLISSMVIIFPYADLYRSSNDPNIKHAIEKTSYQNPLVFSGDYDSFQQVMNGMRMVQSDGYQYGKQIASSLLFWVPRSLWPSKGEPTGVLIAEKTGYNFLNLSAPLWIEFYVDGGLVFVFFGFLFYGIFIRWLDDARRMHVGAPTPLFLFATVYAGYQIFLLRGSLMPAVAYLSPVVPVLLACGRRYKYQRVNTSLIHRDQTK